MTTAKRVRGTPRRTVAKIQGANIVQLADYQTPPPRRPKRKKGESIYELYPMPFFNRKERCTWKVAPTGNYAADCETGHAFAIEFMKSCDGTRGWAALVGWIVFDMIKPGPETNGIIVGFMSVIGEAVATVMTRPGQGGAA
jgi:hypothetical protein